jgi:hypothetical protein
LRHWPTQKNERSGAMQKRRQTMKILAIAVPLAVFYTPFFIADHAG